MYPTYKHSSLRLTYIYYGTTALAPSFFTPIAHHADESVLPAGIAHQLAGATDPAMHALQQAVAISSAVSNVSYVSGSGRASNGFDSATVGQLKSASEPSSEMNTVQRSESRVQFTDADGAQAGTGLQPGSATQNMDEDLKRTLARALGCSGKYRAAGWQLHRSSGVVTECM